MQRYDVQWLSEARAAAGYAVLVALLGLFVDAVGTGLTAPRAMAWTGLAATLLVILLPPRVSVTPGRLTVRSLASTRTVHTDELVSLRWPIDVSERVALRDEHGTHAELDLRLLFANPSLWLQLEADARTSQGRGTFVHGFPCLDRLAIRIEAETAHTVFRVSRLE
ncbi:MULTISPECIES: hypothetical protein [unclassified Streptomyces]|uniref:hypothetical protein n=1 Tax=unclassified Streptomyces TaxID=2593676 RepID=UPI000CD4F01A|nr:hypothetical protein [Streptomyces sp. SM10]